MQRIKSNFELQGYDVGVLSRSKDAVMITDPNCYDNPIVYVNKAFQGIFGYEFRDIVGCNCRFLYNRDSNQEGLEKIKEAINRGLSTTAIVRSYTIDDELVLTELTVGPVFDKESGKLKYLLSIQKILEVD